MAVVVGVLLLAAAVITVLVLSAQAEARCQLPEEPWLGDWTPPAEFTYEPKRVRLHDVYIHTGAGWTDHPDPAAVERAKQEQS